MPAPTRRMTYPDAVSNLQTLKASVMNLDTRIFYSINDFARNTPWLHSLMSWYANDGSAVFAALLVIGWWIARRSTDARPIVAAMWAPLGVLSALIVYDPIALATNETRPCNALHDIVVLHCNTDGGFPSVHAVIAAAVAAGLWQVNHRLGFVSALAALGLAISRVYVGAHYPHDVLAGLGLGAVVSLAGYFLIRPMLQRLVGAIGKTPLRVLITTQDRAA